MPPTLDTERLVLRQFEERDLDAYAAMSADAEVMRYIGQGGPIGRDAAWGQLAFFLGHWALRGYGMWALELRASGRLIGRAGFINPEGWPGLELGWLLARDAWGCGYAAEACAAALATRRAASGSTRWRSTPRAPAPASPAKWRPSWRSWPPRSKPPAARRRPWPRS